MEVKPSLGTALQVTFRWYSPSMVYWLYPCVPADGQRPTYLGSSLRAKPLLPCEYSKGQSVAERQVVNMLHFVGQPIVVAINGPVHTVT